MEEAKLFRQGRYQELVERITPCLYFFCKRYLLDKTALDDLVHESIVTILSRIKSFNPRKGKFSTWCYWVCRSQAALFTRKDALIPIPGYQDLSLRPKWLKGVVDPPRVEDEQLAIRGHQREVVIEYLLLMTPLDRRLLWWRLNNVPVDRIRRKLKMTRQYTEFLLKQAIHRIRRLCENFAD